MSARLPPRPGGAHDRRPRALGTDPRRVLAAWARRRRSTLAANGYKIAGVHLDFRAALAHVEELKAKINGLGSEALYFNMNAADDEKRAAALAALRERFDRVARGGPRRRTSGS